MTTKQIAEAAGVSVDTIIRKAKELFPERIQKGKRIAFSQDEAVQIMKIVRTVKYIEPLTSANAEELDLQLNGPTILSVKTEN